MASLAQHPSHLLALAPRRTGLTARLARAIGISATDDRALASRVALALLRLRDRHRRSVFIIDVHCGDGERLIQAARRARALGFVAIEARGFDRSRSSIRAARNAAARLGDPAIGLGFDVRVRGAALPVEAAEADILIAGPDEPPGEAARILDPAGLLIRS